MRCNNLRWSRVALHSSPIIDDLLASSRSSSWLLIIYPCIASRRVCSQWCRSKLTCRHIDVGNQREMDVLRDELGLAVDRLFNGVEYPPPLPGLKYWSIPPKFKPLTWTNVIDCSASEDDMWRRRQQTTMLIGGIYEVLTPTRRCLSHPTRLRGDDIFQHGKCHAVIIEQGNCAADSTTFNYKDDHAHGPEWILYLYLDDVKRSSFFLILFYFGAGEFAATYFTSYLVLTNWISSLWKKSLLPPYG